MSVDFAVDLVDEMVIYVRKVDPKTNVRSITQRDLHKISLDYFRKNPDLKLRKNPDFGFRFYAQILISAIFGRIWPPWWVILTPCR